MTQTMTASEGLIASLQGIPPDMRPEFFPELLDAAGRMTTAQQAAVIHRLLGSASSYGSEVPQGPVQFPRDHELHLKAGLEWYWVGCNLEVAGTSGQDRIGVLAVMSRDRAVSNAVQEQAGWSDAQAQVVDSSATITVATRADGFIARRRPNVQWAMLGGITRFDTGQFRYQAGPDSMQGSQKVLPLAVSINDGPDFTIDITLSSDLRPDKAFFLQGVDGITPPPSPGIYYSWPQLSASGTVTVRGQRYDVSGTGWIDHQLLMTSAGTLPAPPRPPGWAPPADQFNGWSWCQFNLGNGDAFTASAFQLGPLRTKLPIPSGYYVRRQAGTWNPVPVVGSLDLDCFTPALGGFLQPTAWSYSASDLARQMVDLALVATPWYPDGSFCSGYLVTPCETPVNVALADRARVALATGPGIALTGTGYCESIGYEPEQRYLDRALAFLKTRQA